MYSCLSFFPSFFLLFLLTLSELSFFLPSLSLCLLESFFLFSFFLSHSFPLSLSLFPSFFLLLLPSLCLLSLFCPVSLFQYLSLSVSFHHLFCSFSHSFSLSFSFFLILSLSFSPFPSLSFSFLSFGILAFLLGELFAQTSFSLSLVNKQYRLYIYIFVRA